LVAGGSLAGYLPIDPDWGFVVIVSVGIFWLVGKEKELPQSPELSEPLTTRDTTRVIAFFIFLIVIGLFNLLPYLTGIGYSSGTIAVFLTFDICLSTIIAVGVLSERRRKRIRNKIQKLLEDKSEKNTGL
jgi:succinate-acetate transporter protein